MQYIRFRWILSKANLDHVILIRLIESPPYAQFQIDPSLEANASHLVLPVPLIILLNSFPMADGFLRSQQAIILRPLLIIRTLTSCL